MGERFRDDIESRRIPRPREPRWNVQLVAFSQATGYAGRQENIARHRNIAHRHTNTLKSDSGAATKKRKAEGAVATTEGGIEAVACFKLEYQNNLSAQ